MTDLVPIPGYDRYRISKDGRIWSSKSNRFLKGSSKNSRGYLFVGLTENNKTKFFLTHRLLAFVFLDLPSLESDLEVDHIDGNKTNNSLNNLQVLSKEAHLLKTNGASLYCSKCNINKIQKSRNKTGLCRNCLDNKSNITLDQIVHSVLTHNWSGAAKILGMSDNGLRKRYKKLSGLDPKNIKREKGRITQ
jgi:hypothetical protein